MAKNCDNCINSGRPSYEYPCTVCETAYGSAPSKWEGVVPATADMVEVVRCKDCKQLMLWCKPTDKVIGECFIRKMNSEDEQFCMVGADDFCSYGERKDNG